MIHYNSSFQLSQSTCSSKCRSATSCTQVPACGCQGDFTCHAGIDTLQHALCMTRGSTQLHSNTQPAPTAADTPRDFLHLLLPQKTTPSNYCTMTHPKHAAPRIFVYLDDATSPLPLSFSPKLPQLIQSYVPPPSTATIPPIFRACPTLTRASATTARSTPVGRATAGTRLPPMSPGTVGSTRSCARSTTGFGRRSAMRAALSVWWLLSRRGRGRARAARMARWRAERATGQAGPGRRRGGSSLGEGGIS